VPSSAQGLLVWLTFDGVFRSCDVYLNGAFVMHHEEGYTSFHAYIHNASAPLLFGDTDNVIAVYVDASDHELWAYEGAGIYRHVWLETAGVVSAVPWGFAAPTFVTGNITGDDASGPQTTDGAVFAPTLDVHNADAVVANGTVTFELREVGGSDAAVVTATAPFSLSPGGWSRVALGVTGAQTIAFGSAASPVRLWNTAARPPLYDATATVTVGGAVVDEVTARIGVRSAVFDPSRGFVLNGVPVKMKGTANHIGFGPVGAAVPDRVAAFQVATLRAVGANAWRTAHNPVAPELLDACDESGMLVWEENRFVTAGVQPSLRSSSSRSNEGGASSSDNANTVRDVGVSSGSSTRWTPPTGGVADPRLLQDAQDMALRDRNHPSIVVWSLCNELGCVAGDPNGAVLAEQFKEAIGAADKTRPITGNTVQIAYLGGECTCCSRILMCCSTDVAALLLMC
jgi:beta-galactosidase